MSCLFSQHSAFLVIASGGGVSCSSDVRGGSADDAGPQSAASEDADPALGTSVISTGEDDYTGQRSCMPRQIQEPD